MESTETSKVPVYLSPEQAASEFGSDEKNRPFVTKHEIRRFAKASGIYSKLSRGKMAFTEAQLDQLKRYIVDQQRNPVNPRTGEIDHFMA